MRTIALLLAAPALADPNHWKMFNEFKTKFNVTFNSPEEDAARFKIFKKNMGKADAMNKGANGKATFGITKFSHLTTEEFQKKHNGFKKNHSIKRAAKKVQPKDVKVQSIDWRTIGGVTPVKDQGQCGSCWAFSATQAAETGYYVATGDLKILSPQQTVSCDREDLACNGGDTPTAYQYMELAGGVEEESEYPYTSGDTEVRGRCRADSSEFAVKLDSYSTIAEGASDEDDMYTQMQSSPMSICVDASSWQMYMGGVVDSTTCGTELDHCVHVVGLSAGNWWIVKNSWNTDWGEDGYIRVATGENACGIAEEATIAVASGEYAPKKKRERVGTLQDVIDIVEGVTEGFGIHTEAKCIKDSEDMLYRLQDVYNKMQEKTPIAMMEALKELANVMEQNVPAAMKACEATKKEIQKIFAALRIFKSPREFLYHVGKDLEINGVDIYSNMNDSVGHFKKKEYHAAGLSLGTALNLLVIGKEEAIDAGKDTIYV